MTDQKYDELINKRTVSQREACIADRIETELGYSIDATATKTTKHDVQFFGNAQDVLAPRSAAFTLERGGGNIFTYDRGGFRFLSEPGVTTDIRNNPTGSDPITLGSNPPPNIRLTKFDPKIRRQVPDQMRTDHANKMVGEQVNAHRVFAAARADCAQNPAEYLVSEVKAGVSRVSNAVEEKTTTAGAFFKKLFSWGN
jgi:hypothetical protein